MRAAQLSGVGMVLLAACAAAPHLRAQYHYWPAGFANQPGGSAQATPFSISPNTATSNTRALCTLKAASLPFGPGTVLNELAFRRDSQQATGYPAVNGNLRVKIGVVPDAMRPSGRFQSAWLGEPQQVFNGTPFSLPNAPFPGSGTAAPFDRVIPFTKPFTYLGGDLGIDIEWTGPPNTDWKRDAIQLPFDQSGDFRALGAGCPGSTTYGPNLWVDVQNLRPGGSINLRLDGCAPPALASFYLGLPTTSPVPLSPFGLGAPCAAHIGPALTWNSLVGDVSTRYARARLDLPLPNDPLLIGAPLSFQALALDFFVASSAPFVSSNAIDVICGAPSGIAPVEYGRTIWVWGSRGNNRVDGSFVSPPNYVPVIRFG